MWCFTGFFCLVFFSKTVFVDSVKGLGIRSSCMGQDHISEAGVLRTGMDEEALKTEAYEARGRIYSHVYKSRNTKDIQKVSEIG